MDCAPSIFLRDEIQSAHGVAEQLLERAQRAHDPTMLLLAYEALGQTSHQKGEFQLMREQLEIAVPHYDRELHRSLAFMIGADPEGSLPILWGLTLWHLGYPEQALKMGKRALMLAQELSYPHTLAFAEFFSCLLCQLRCEATAIREGSERGIALCAEHGYRAIDIVDLLARLGVCRNEKIAKTDLSRC
jgi:hypothetical protein